MIFKFTDNIGQFKDIESYKERNFYYKVFTGYLFNELLPDYQKNKVAFFNLLTEQISGEQSFGKQSISDAKLTQILDELLFNDIHVSFDYHLVQMITDYPDRGEVSDIIIWGKDYFVSIEVKYLSDWTFEKDLFRFSNGLLIWSKRLTKREFRFCFCQMKNGRIIKSI